MRVIVSLGKATSLPIGTFLVGEFMLRSAKRFWVLAAVACLVAAQFHIWVEFDSCHWNPAQTHRGSAHKFGHGCHGCLSQGWLMAPALPGFAFSPCAARLEVEMPSVATRNPLAAVSSPRAPPLS